MLITFNSGETSHFLLPSSVWGHVTNEPGVQAVAGHLGAPALMEWLETQALASLSPQFHAGAHADNGNPLWLTAGFHTVPTTRRVAPLFQL